MKCYGVRTYSMDFFFVIIPMELTTYPTTKLQLEYSNFGECTGVSVLSWNSKFHIKKYLKNWCFIISIQDVGYIWKEISINILFIC